MLITDWAKVILVIKCTSAVFVDNFRNISTSWSIQVSVCRGTLSIKEIIQHANVWIPKGMKNAVSIYIAFTNDILIRNEHITPRNTKQKAVWADLASRLNYKPSRWVDIPIVEVIAQSIPYEWLFYFWLPFQLWGLITHSTFKIISNRFLYFHFWSKCHW